MSIAPRSPIPKLADLDVHLTTARCKLRPLRDDDVDDLWPTVSDPAFSKWMSWSAHVDRDETLEFIRAQRRGFANGTDLVWAIEHEGRAAGCIGFGGIRWEMRAWRVDRAELGYWLTPALTKQGLMTEAALAVLGFGFDTLGLHKITVGCIAENVASRRVIEKCGFRHVGRAEDDVWRDGQWWAHLRYEMTAPEFADTTSTRRFIRGSQ
jgi:ribosomal-protein-alanine N-acetyltransferase